MGRKDNIAGDGRRELQNGITTLFLIYMGAAYPLIMHDKYFDITVTKYRAFYIALCIYAVLMVLVDVLGRNVSTGHGSQSLGGNEDASAGAAHGSRFIGRLRHFMDMHNIMTMDIFMAGFVLANVLAFFMSGNKVAAYTGEEGRRCGLQFVLLAFFLYVCMARYCRIRRYVVVIFMLAGSFVGIVGICQFMGYDFLGLREGLMQSIRNVYISTFGNIDIFASFLCVLVPVAAGAYISSEGKESIVIRITAVIAVLTGTGAVIISNANLAYAGVGGAMVAAWIWASYRGKIKEFADVCLVMACGVLAISIMLGRTDNGYSELDGLSCFVSDSRMVWIVSVVVLVVWAAIRLASKWTVKFRGKAALAVSVGVSLAGIVAVVIYAAHNHMGIFSFEDSWGNYRGFVWRRLMEAYRDFSVPQRLFGYGNESVKAIMTDRYYDDMMNTVGVIYDNAHNEYLQYLITTGIFGAVSYVGLLVTTGGALVRTAVSEAAMNENENASGQSAGKRSKEKKTSRDSRTVRGSKTGTGLECLLGYAEDEGSMIAVLLGITGYAVQAFVNLNQSLTTPYIFLLIAMAGGLCRRYRCRSEIGGRK
uniref:O-antigen ligase family protein n=1 Tax=Coprococcus sp. TaxID=2049024 RepID=UPI004028D608